MLFYWYAFLLRLKYGKLAGIDYIKTFHRLKIWKMRKTRRHVRLCMSTTGNGLSPKARRYFAQVQRIRATGHRRFDLSTNEALASFDSFGLYALIDDIYSLNLPYSCFANITTVQYPY